MSEIGVGNFVTIGDNDLTWEVVGLPELNRRFATLKSGQTGRLRLEPLERLRFHSKAVAL